MQTVSLQPDSLPPTMFTLILLIVNRITVEREIYFHLLWEYDNKQDDNKFAPIYYYDGIIILFGLTGIL